MTNREFTKQQQVLGRVSSLGVFYLGLVYSIAVILNGFMTNPSSYVNNPLFYLITLSVVFIAPFLIASMGSVYAYTKPEMRSYSLIAFAFMLFAAGLTSCINLMVFTVGLQIETLVTSIVSFFLPFKWPTPIFVLDTLAWFFLFGLSMLFAAPIFREDRLEKMLRLIMTASGILCIVGWIILPFVEILGMIIGAMGYGPVALIVFGLLSKVFNQPHVKARSTFSEKLVPNS